MENMEIWNALKRPPPEALKTIQAGRLKGKSDINPQWRYQAMTEQFGPCGVGWKYEIKRLWSEPGAEQLIFAFAEILLFYKNGTVWSEPIPGTGGSMLVAKESSGPYSSDEAYKMAVTDGLSVAMKMIGVAADIYAGKWDGSKYQDAPAGTPKSEPKTDGDKEMSSKQWEFVKKIGKDEGLTESETIEIVKWVASELKVPPRHWKVAKALLPKENFQDQILKYNEVRIKEPLVEPF